MMENDIREAKDLTVKDNLDIMRWLLDDWHLGPKIAVDNNQGNNEFWGNMAKVWRVTDKEARRKSCANCEYGHIDPEHLEAMEHIPYNKFDKDGGMRVWCDRFDFICHATRVCQNWEKD